MTETNDQYYLTQPEAQQSCLLALRAIILKQDTTHITETRKYGMPCFCYQGKMFAYLWTDKQTTEPYILFVEGKHLHHPDLETGTRSRMKIFRINPAQDLPIGTIKLLLNEALDLYRGGVVAAK